MDNIVKKPVYILGMVRMSTVEQEMSPHEQERLILEYAKFIGVPNSNIEVFHDHGVSARLIKLADRPEGKKLCARALELQSKGYDVKITATQIDRVFRNTVDGITMEEIWRNKGIAMLFVSMGGASFDTSTAVGRFIFKILLSNAEFEAETTSERTTKAFIGRRKTGYATSNAIWGTVLVGEEKMRRLIWKSQNHKNCVELIHSYEGKASAETIAKIAFGGTGIEIGRDSVRRIINNKAHYGAITEITQDSQEVAQK